MKEFIFDVQRFDDINNTVDGGTWTGTDADEEHGTTDYDTATEKTTVYSALYGMGGNDKLTNYPAFANVTIDGGTGDDQIYNRGANGSLIGGEGNDYIQNKGVDNAKVNNSTIEGGADDDVVDNLGDNVLISVGDDADSVYSSGEKATITGGAGADTLYSYGNYSSIDGGEDDDNLIADGSNVTVHGGAGNDTLQFSGGSDSIASNGIVEDTIGNNYFHSEYITTSTITGGTGNDTLYSAHIEDVTINLGAGDNSVVSNYDKNVTIQALGGADTVTIYDGSNINLNVGDGANILNISILNDSDASVYTINAGTGADSVKIDVNNALINLGDGDNTITTGGYEAGNNVTINSGVGADYIVNYYRTDKAKVSRQENVLINAGAGNDTIDNTGSKTTIDAGEGDDIISSYYGENVSISGGAGADEIFGNNATLNGGADNDTIRAGDNTLIQYAAGDGNDLIQNFGIDDTLSIGGTYSTVTIGGDVILTVGENNITLSGAASLETLNIVGGEAVENWATVTTGTISTAIDKSATVASGTTGDDTIKTEQISGDTTARLIEGNGGNDSILNFVSKVTISGGADKDSVVSSADNVVIQTGGGNDYIQGATKGNVNITIDAGDGDDEIDTYGTNASINGGAGNDSIKISADSEKVTVIAGEGSDTVVNTATDSFIDGGAGADSIHNDSGNVTIDAGADDDVITSYGDKVSISGGAGADKIIVTNSYDGVGTISGGIGDDTVSIGSGNFLLEYTSGDGADVINGFKANDTLYIDGKYSTATIGTDLLVTVGSGTLTLQGAATLESVNVLNEDDISAASFVTNLQQKTEYGYPVIAGLFFHPEEYHGFETLPSSFYASSETLTINSSDGLELTGYHYTPENPNDKWVILVHGYGHNHKHMNGFAMQYLTNNYHVLEIDQRAAGDSQGEWLTMGAAEGNDVALWTQKIAEINSKAKITLHGVSMGAATAMLAAANSGLTNVTSLVEDCGYTSVLKLVDIVKSGYPALGDPEYVSLVSDTAGKLTGHKLTEAAPIDSIGSVTIPSMFITGTSDAVVSPSMLETLYAASGAEVKEIFTVEGATHGISALTDSIGYGNAVFRFNAEAAGEGWVTSNVTDSISLRGTKYDDTITSSGSNVTINTGVGDDTITNSGSNNIYIYNDGDGNDNITGFTANDTIIIDEGTGTYSTVKSNDDVIVAVGDGNVTLKDAANFETLNIQGEFVTALEINNTLDNTLVQGTPIDDTITNTGNNVRVEALAGNDFIVNGDIYTLNNESGSNSSIFGGTGNDTINNISNNNAYLDAGDGNDLIINSLYYTLVPDGSGSGKNTLESPYSGTTIDAGAGDDNLIVTGGSTINVSMGDGDDSVVSRHSYYMTLDGGAGNDFIAISEGDHEKISGGDGNDSIIGAIIFETVEGEWGMGGYANIDGGAGADYISVGYSNNSTIDGGADNDTILAYGKNSNFDGGEGDDVITLLTDSTKPTLTSAGATVTGGVGNDTISISDDSGIVINYTQGDGDDVINGITANDTLVVDGDIYRTKISGNDKIVSVVGSQNTITLKDAANVEFNIVGEEYVGKTDKEGTEIENPVAMIVSDGETYYYESVARATNDADNNSTVTVTANSTETSTINTTKGLTIQFAESGLGVYSVTGGNFVSADSSTAAQFSIDSSRVLSNANSLLINNNATATVDGYVVKGTSNGYTFNLQNDAATINGVAYNGSGTATFDSTNKVTLTSGAIVTDESFVTSDSGIVLAAGSYTINGATVTTAATQTIYLNSDYVYFAVDSNAVTYNGMTFNGKGSVSIADGMPTITANVSASSVDNVVLSASGHNTINGFDFWMTEGVSEGVTVGTFEGGISSAHIILAEDFPEDAGKTFYEEAYISNDNDYTVRIDHEGIRSIYGISSGAVVRGSSSVDGETDTLGSVLQLAVDGSGSYTFGNKTYTLNGEIDSVNVVALTSRFYNDGSSMVRNVYYLNGTISGDFSSAVTINNSAMPVQILGDTQVDIYATDSVKAAVGANSSGKASVISGVGNGASILSAGGATKVTTNEEGTFVFRSSGDTQQAFTVSGDSSVDFILRNYTDENGKPTMQVEGVNNFENGYYSFNSDTAYHGINVGETINASDELEMVFSDVATFTIVDSKVVSVGGIDGTINNLTSDVTVHATGAMTVNKVYVDVTGDTDYNVAVADSKTAGLTNISSGATVSVSNIYVSTDNSGDFKIGENIYSVNDTVDNSATFTTDENGEVKNITGLNGTLKTTKNNVTINGAAFETTNTDVTITAADSYIAKVDGLKTGDTISGAFDSAEILMPGSVDTDSSMVTINDKAYTLTGDANGTTFEGDAGGITAISGLDSGASLKFGAAGNYLINDTNLSVNVGDIVIGTAENAAYVYDPNNIPLDVESMTDEEIQSQAGITTEYSNVVTDTMLTSQLIENGGSGLNGSMELALDNSDAISGQTADFSSTTGVKKVTLEGGEQSVAFNNEGGNVAVIDSDSTGEKNVTLGGGGDLAIIKATDTPVNITAGSGKDTIVTSGNNVQINMSGGATKIVANGGSVSISNYDASTGAGIQLNETADIARAVASNNITLEAGAISFGNSKVNFSNSDETSSVVNLYNNQGKKQKVGYTNIDGGEMNMNTERENLLLVGNKDGGKDGSSFMAGSGDDTALGGVGDYFDLGSGNNYVSIGDNSRNTASEGATVAMTSATGQTEVDGFNFGFNENSDKVRFDISNAQVSFKDGKLTFNIGSASLILNLAGSSSDLAESADLIEDDNFIGSTTLDEISPITYEQGDYQFGEEDWTVASGQTSLVSAQ